MKGDGKRAINKLVTVTTLVENTALGRGLLAEHGLSFWIDTGTHRVLFDAGQGGVIQNNAARLGIDLSTADAIVCSHGHDDHVGGMEALIPLADEATIHFHPRSRESKYRVKDGGAIKISTDFWEGEGLDAYEPRHRAESGASNLFDELVVTGEIPRKTPFEKDEPGFALDPDGKQPDHLVDDQAISFNTEKGVVAVLGCAHAGVVNTIRYIAELHNVTKLYAVMGGMHLLNADAGRVEKTIKAFRDFDVQRIGLCHCTGIEATVAFWQAFPGKCFQCPAGSVFSFGRVVATDAGEISGKD